MEVRAVLEKEFEPIVTTEVGMVTRVNLLQFKNASVLIADTEVGMVRKVKEVPDSKEAVPIIPTEVGMVIELKAKQ